MFEELKKEVYRANMLLPEYGLAPFTWGNASGVDRDRNIAFHFYHDYTNENDLAWVATIMDENGKEISSLESAKNEYQVTTGVIELKKGTYYILIENDLYSSEDTYWFRIVE